MYFPIALGADGRFGYPQAAGETPASAGIVQDGIERIALELDARA